MGKSRLCDEFARQCERQGVVVRRAAGVAHARRVPLVPILAWWRDEFGITADDTIDGARTRIRQRLVGLDPAFEAYAEWEVWGLAFSVRLSDLAGEAPDRERVERAVRLAEDSGNRSAVIVPTPPRGYSTWPRDAMMRRYASSGRRSPGPGRPAPASSRRPICSPTWPGPSWRSGT